MGSASCFVMFDLQSESVATPIAAQVVDAQRPLRLWVPRPSAHHGDRSGNCRDEIDRRAHAVLVRDAAEGLNVSKPKVRLSLIHI